MDDKSKVPIGEPGTPEAATSHNRRALTTKNVTLTSSVRNYHFSNLTPSVNLIVSIPESPTNSFYTGDIFVGIKDSVFEPSNPLRHIVELISVLRRQNQLGVPYLTLFSDGGGDHNITFLLCAMLSAGTIQNW